MAKRQETYIVTIRYNKNGEIEEVTETVVATSESEAKEKAKIWLLKWAGRVAIIAISAYFTGDPGLGSF